MLEAQDAELQPRSRRWLALEFEALGVELHSP